MNDVNKREMIYHEKSILQVSKKLDITLISFMNASVIVTDS